MKHKNISPSLFLENFSNQRRTPKSEANQAIEAARPQFQQYFYRSFANGQRRFFDQMAMNYLRWEEEVRHSLRKRLGK